MRRDWKSWWPALPALAVLYLGMFSFIEKYPRPTHGSRQHASVARPDSLLILARDASEKDSVASSRGDSALVAPPRNPFQTGHSTPASMSRRSHASLPPPPRGYSLRGTVGNSVATVVDLTGHSRIVRVGDRVDSAEVVAIEVNKVILRDRSGRFELLQGK